jgi:uncharacterized protein
MQLSDVLHDKLNELIGFIENKQVIVAFSGGIDSSLLAYLSQKYAKKTLLLTVSSSIFSKTDLHEATQFAQNQNIPHKIIEVNLLQEKAFRKNNKDRCYICKRLIFTKFKEFCENLQHDIIIEGSNISDIDDYRPGYKAIQELGISTPYINAGINKQEIVTLSDYFNLKVKSKPPNACLATRISYGILIEEELLQKIENAEKFLKMEFEISQVRVRYHRGPLARIEFLEEDMYKIFNRDNLTVIKAKLKEMGFIYITFDIEGYRKSGLIHLSQKNSIKK